MTREQLTASEAQSALAEVEHGRRRVVEEIGMPLWYWWGLALGWIVVGIVADLDRPWLGGAVTLLFGAVHAAFFSRVRSGRRRTSQLSVRASTGLRHTSLFVLLSLLVLVAITITAAVLAAADGARHPATMASVLTAVCILLGGPAAMDRLRRIVLREK